MLTSICRWLYSLFLAVDANFRLKLKERGIEDPDIGSGWAYFVESRRYIEHLSQNTDVSQKTSDVEVSDLTFNSAWHSFSIEVTGCSSDFHAVNQVNRKSKKAYAATGVVACVCARHSLMRKNGVGDLQRGERWVYMFYNAEVSNDADPVTLTRTTSSRLC